MKWRIVCRRGSIRGNLLYGWAGSPNRKAPMPAWWSFEGRKRKGAAWSTAADSEAA